MKNTETERNGLKERLIVLEHALSDKKDNAVKPGFHMIVTIVAIATIARKFDWTIATILTIHGFHMIVAIIVVTAVLWLNASKQVMDILFSLLLLLIVPLPILSQSDHLLKMLVIGFLWKHCEFLQQLSFLYFSL